LERLRPINEAAWLAWGELEDRWHQLHGARITGWQCAGCGEPIGGRPALQFADGNRVHFDRIGCVLAHGNRWRAEARAALTALGLDPPLEREP
jgi:hypothetical protein